MTNYRLPLADGRDWCLCATQATREWVAECARIMELEVVSRASGLVLAISRGTQAQELSTLPTCCTGPVGKEICDLGVVRFLRLARPGQYLCVLGPDHTQGEQYVQMGEALLPVFLEAVEHGGLPFHCAMAEHQGKAILIGASGGVGKSTSARRLPPPWRALADDEALIVKTPEGYRVHPFPTWSDYYWNRRSLTWATGKHYPLAGIFIIERATTDSIEPLETAAAAVMMNQLAGQVCLLSWRRLPRLQSRNLRLRFLDNAAAIARAVPTFKLRLSLHGRFWEGIEQALGQGSSLAKS